MPLTLIAALATGCRLDALPSPPITPSLMPTAGTCTVHTEALDGRGQRWIGMGFPPDVPVAATIVHEDGTTQVVSEANDPGLHTDARGRFEVQGAVDRSDIGRNELRVAAGGCVASTEFEVSVDLFPSASPEQLWPAPRPARRGVNLRAGASSRADRRAG